jgi:hypothetical protein
MCFLKAPAIVIGTCILAVALLGAYWMNNQHPQQPQQQSQPAPQVQTPPINQFDGIQNDSEGYNKHAWGTPFETFKNDIIKSMSMDIAKNWSKTPEGRILWQGMEYDSVEEIFNKEKLVTDWSVKAYHSDLHQDSLEQLGTNTLIAMGHIEHVPAWPSDDMKAGRPQAKYEPRDMLAYYDDKDGVYYVFHKGSLYFASAKVSSDPSDILKSKYQFVGHEEFGTTYGDLHDRFSLDLYKRGQTNTRVYYVSCPNSRFLIYIPSAYLYQLGAEVSATVRADNEQQEQAARAAQAQTDSETHKQVQ